MNLNNEFQISKTIGLKEYDSFMDQNPLEQEYMLVAVKNSYVKNNNLKILEIGSGTGRFTKKLLKYFPKSKFFLVELDKECVEKLTEQFNLPNVTIIQSSMEDFISKDKFDIICFATSFHHIHYKNKEFVLKKIRGLLSNDGLLVLSDNFIGDYSSEDERIKVLIDYHDKWIYDCISENDAEGEAMARKMKELVLKEDGGEYFLSPEKFELLISKTNLKILGKVNVTNNPLFKDGNKYFYLISN